jgi:large subunit ribosomal protein L18e
MVNQIVTHLAKELKNASKKNDAPIWLKLAKTALKSNSTQKTINLKKINENSDEGNAIIIPGKVLGTGILSHKIILASFSISNSAAKKIKDSGGEIIKFSEMIEKFPTGTGVKIIG